MGGADAERSYSPVPAETGVGDYCTTRDAGGKRWMIIFEDADMPRPTFTDEADARLAFAKAEARGWNCHLFETCRRDSPTTQGNDMHTKTYRIDRRLYVGDSECLQQWRESRTVLVIISEETPGLPKGTVVVAPRDPWDPYPSDKGEIPFNFLEMVTSNPILEFFEYTHLPSHLQEASEPFCALALRMDERLPDGPEKSAGLRKLLEAKDCFVRAYSQAYQAQG